MRKRSRGGHYHHGDLERALTDAAIALVAKKGPSALSLRAVARMVGVTATAAYRHFEDKADLLAAIAAESLRMLADAMRAADEGGDGLLGSFANVGLAYIDFAKRQPARFRMLSLPEVADARSRPELASAYESAFSVLVSAIQRCQREGLVRRGDAKSHAIFAWSAVHGAAWLLVDGQIEAARADADADRVARRVVRAIFEGLTSTPLPST